MTRPFSVRCVAHGPVAAYAFPCRYRGRSRVVAVATANLEMVSNGVARFTSAPNVLLEDDVVRSRSGERLARPSEICPPLPMAEFLVEGAAYAPRGSTTAAAAVRVLIGAGATSVTKTLHVYGDRFDIAGAPSPFDWMPMVYERAIGGPGTDNPVGRSAGDLSGAPNVLDPQAPWAVAGMGPLAASWPARRRLAEGSGVPTISDGVLEVPDGLSLDWFQAAPTDQRIDAFLADSWITVDGMHPMLARIQTRLPGCGARARWCVPGVSVDEQELRLDRLFVAPDRSQLQLTWRGWVDVDEQRLQSLVVEVAVGAELSTLVDDSISAVSRTWVEASPHVPETALPWKRQPSPVPSATLPSSSALPFRRAEGPGPSASGAASQSAKTVPLPALLRSSDGTFQLGGAPSWLARAPSASRVDEVPEDSSPTPSERVSGDGSVESVDDADTMRPPALEGSVGADDVVEVEELARSGAVVLDDAAMGLAASDFRDRSGDVIDDPVIVGSAVAHAEPFRSLREQVLERVTSGQTLEGLILAGADLTEIDLSGANLKGVDFTGAVLVRARLDRASFVGGRLVSAQLDGASMAGADLTSVDLTSASLDDAGLTGAVLVEASFAMTRARGARFDDVRAHRARFDGMRWTSGSAHRACFEDASFRSACLDETDFTEAILSRAVFDDATAHRARFANAEFEAVSARGGSFVDATLTNIRARRSNWEGAALDGSSLSGAQLEGAKLVRATAANATFDHACLRDAVLTGWSAEEVDLRAASLKGADLQQGRLSRAHLDGANLEGANATKLTGAGISARGARLGNAKLRGARLRGADLSDASLDGCDLSDADLTDANLLRTSRVGTKLAGATLRGAQLDRESPETPR